MRPPDSAVPLRTLVWDAEAVPERCSSMPAENRPSIQNSAVAAVVVQKNAEAMRSLMWIKKAVIDYDKCKGCGRCIGACSFDAVYNPNSSANELLDRKMAEYAQAVCHGRPCFHISLVQDISPNCDCHGENDAPILPDIGMFASFDPVALDQACADACLKATPIADSQLGEHLAEPDWHCHHDHFKDSNPNIEWKATLDQAEKIVWEPDRYELKRIK